MLADEQRAVLLGPLWYVFIDWQGLLVLLVRAAAVLVRLMLIAVISLGRGDCLVKAAFDFSRLQLLLATPRLLVSKQAAWLRCACTPLHWQRHGHGGQWRTGRLQRQQLSMRGPQADSRQPTQPMRRWIERAR